MIISIKMENVKLDKHEVLDALKSALGIKSDWYIQDGKVMKDDPYIEHSKPEIVDFSPEVYKAYLVIQNALIKNRRSV